MRAVVRGIAWLGILIGICVAPLAFALISTDRPGQGFWTDFSIALGFVGLALMGIEFALVARVKPIAEPFGTDALVDFHRQIGYAGLAFVLVHVALSAEWRQVTSFTPAETPARVLFGAVAAAALVVLVATSVWRRQLRLSYELWQILHAVLAVVAIAAALVHVLLVNYYVDTVWKQVLWSLMTAAFIWLLVWVRLLALSMLETLADRDDVRPVVLFAGNRTWDTIIFRTRIDELTARLNLKVVHVLEDPPPDWTAETGYLNADIFTRHLPVGYPRFQFFACGPNPMLDAVETALVTIGTPADRIHTERFDWV
jgi:predicted ferric reductase